MTKGRVGHAEGKNKLLRAAQELLDRNGHRGTFVNAVGEEQDAG